MNTFAILETLNQTVIDQDSFSIVMNYIKKMEEAEEYDELLKNFVIRPNFNYCMNELNDINNLLIGGASNINFSSAILEQIESNNEWEEMRQQDWDDYYDY